MTNDGRIIGPSEGAYRLVQLTAIEDIEFCHLHNFVQWASGLSKEQYLAREKGVKAALARGDMKLTYWALEKRGDSGAYEIVSGCESVCRPALYKVKGQEIRETISHSIGSVFTPAANRGQGYAKVMMRLLVEALNELDAHKLTAEQRDHTLIALWSDIGDYYAQFGYKLTDSCELKIKLGEHTDPALEFAKGITPVSSTAEIAKLASADEEHMRSTIDHDTEHDGVPRVVIAPRPGVFNHTNWRAEYSGPLVSKTVRQKPTVFGAKHASTWMLWTQDFLGNKLYGLRIGTTSESRDEVLASLVELVGAAVVEANKWKLSAVCIWEPDFPLGITADEVATAYKASDSPEHKTIESAESWTRPDSLPMYHFEGARQNLKWEFDGKYAWF